MAKLYDIKLNGYKIGQTRGKHSAVLYIEKVLAWNGISKDNYCWESRPLVEILRVNLKDNGYYSIEENKGE